MAQDSDRDIREEVGVALFWRELIGDYEYVKFNPDDMLRWYDALTLRGPEEIRELMDERYSGRPMGVVQGIVTGKPHPPAWLVREWLMHHETKIRTGGYWMAAGGFVLLSFIVAPFMYGCTTLTPVNMYVMNPPNNQPQPYQASAPVGSNFTAPPTTPPVAFMPGQTTPQSGGIAGAAMGTAPAAGVTGSANVGLSNGAVTPAPAIGGSPP
jgi:hypothetical protein